MARCQKQLLLPSLKMRLLIFKSTLCDNEKNACEIKAADFPIQNAYAVEWSCNQENFISKHVRAVNGYTAWPAVGVTACRNEWACYNQWFSESSGLWLFTISLRMLFRCVTMPWRPLVECDSEPIQETRALVTPSICVTNSCYHALSTKVLRKILE